MSPDEYCQHKAASSGSSFYYGFLFLPAQRRRAITALYALCREIDDVVDECADPALARIKLEWWRGEIASIEGGVPQHPVTRALAAAAGGFDLPQAQLGELVDGMHMDLERNRYEDFDSLLVYCHRVAGVVGQLSARIFGFRDPATLDYAHELGIAFQLTNIVRDVGEDARRGRIYLPADEQARFGVSPEDILSGRHSPAFRALMEFEIERAERYYASALAALPSAERRAQRPGLVMTAIYRTLLAEIRRDGCRVLDRKIELPPLRKLWIAWRTWLAG
ncbi:MAG: presqualene diphosphate synthase HpnD [Rhodocyclaceae bacterium]